jgi:predicted nucleic acid-binding protein
VLDASVAIKWFRDEPGSVEARKILRAHGAGDLTIVVPSLFVYEFLGVATRLLKQEESRELWRRFLGWRLQVREVGQSLMGDALGIRELYGCSFYDAVAPALAGQLGAPLYSADRRAHGAVPGVVLLDEAGGAELGP